MRMKMALCACVVSGLLFSPPVLAQDTGTTGTTDPGPTPAAPAPRNVTEAQRAENMAAAAAASNPDKAVSASDIMGMRASGLGWGQIAQSLGLHPSVSGMGSVNRSEQASEKGAAKGAGSSADKGSGSGGGSGKGGGGGGGGKGGGGGRGK